MEVYHNSTQNNAQNQREFSTYLKLNDAVCDQAKGGYDSDGKKVKTLHSGCARLHAAVVFFLRGRLSGEVSDEALFKRARLAKSSGEKYLPVIYHRQVVLKHMDIWGRRQLIPVDPGFPKFAWGELARLQAIDEKEASSRAVAAAALRNRRRQVSLADPSKGYVHDIPPMAAGNEASSPPSEQSEVQSAPPFYSISSKTITIQREKVFGENRNSFRRYESNVGGSVIIKVIKKTTLNSTPLCVIEESRVREDADQTAEVVLSHSAQSGIEKDAAADLLFNNAGDPFSNEPQDQRPELVAKKLTGVEKACQEALTKLGITRSELSPRIETMRGLVDTDEQIAQVLVDAVAAALGTPAAKVKTTRRAIMLGTVDNLARQRRAARQDTARALAEEQREYATIEAICCGNQKPADVIARLKVFENAENSALGRIKNAARVLARSTPGYSNLSDEGRLARRKPYILQAFLAWERGELPEPTEIPPPKPVAAPVPKPVPPKPVENQKAFVRIRSEDEIRFEENYNSLSVRDKDPWITKARKDLTKAGDNSLRSVLVETRARNLYVESRGADLKR